MKTYIKKAGLLILAAFVGGLISVGAYKLMEKKDFQFAENSIPGKFARYNIGNFTVPAFDFAVVSDLTTPTVVHIKTKTDARQNQQNYEFDNPFDMFEYFHRGMPPSPGPRQASGSGVIISEDGYIVTNNHVVEDADNIEVVLNDKRTYDAEVIGIDQQTDLAVLKIKEKNLTYINFGNSDSLKVGEWVIAVGNPFNLTSTVTAGIVSAKGRNLNLLRKDYAIESFIQTDAAVNPGNSGGALVNIRGELVGINTAIASESGQFIGYSFAIPVNIVQKVIKDIISYGSVKRGVLGIRVSEVTVEIAEKYNLAKPEGVLVYEIMENSAAGEAGIKKGDIILSIDNVPVNSVPELQENVSKHKPGDIVKVNVFRNEKEKLFDVKLLDANNYYAASEVPGKLNDKIGAELENITQKEAAKFSIRGGVRVKDLKAGKFRDAGIPKNFIITKIDKTPVTQVSEVMDILGKADDGILIEGINPDGSKGYYGLSLK